MFNSWAIIPNRINAIAFYTKQVKPTLHLTIFLLNKQMK